MLIPIFDNRSTDQNYEQVIHLNLTRCSFAGRAYHVWDMIAINCSFHLNLIDPSRDRSKRYIIAKTNYLERGHLVLSIFQNSKLHMNLRILIDLFPWTSPFLNKSKYQYVGRIINIIQFMDVI
jgi:hypothetical protein